MAMQHKIPIPFTVICKTCKTEHCRHTEPAVAPGNNYYNHGTMVRRNSDGKLFKEAIMHSNGHVEWIPFEET